jgi:hypothetical protein
MKKRASRKPKKEQQAPEVCQSLFAETVGRIALSGMFLVSASLMTWNAPSTFLLVHMFLIPLTNSIAVACALGFLFILVKVLGGISVLFNWHARLGLIGLMMVTIIMIIVYGVYPLATTIMFPADLLVKENLEVFRYVGYQCTIFGGLLLLALRTKEKN